MAPDSTSPAPHPDDWDSHWDEFADTASDNPAQRYRQALILRQIHQYRRPARILDIGSGQGDLLVALGAEWPDAELAGFELSATGIERTREKVPGARLAQVDLLTATEPDTAWTGWADVAICSEVLEHVEHPDVLLRNAARSVATGGRVVITVPGGPRTAFDRHIGHRRHYDRDALRTVIVDAGLIPQVVGGQGFPFFNLYKLIVLARGERLVADAAASAPPSRLASTVMQLFGTLLKPGRCSSRVGWQMVAVAGVP